MSDINGAGAAQDTGATAGLQDQDDGFQANFDSFLNATFGGDDFVEGEQDAGQEAAAAEGDESSGDEGSSPQGQQAQAEPQAAPAQQPQPDPAGTQANAQPSAAAAGTPAGQQASDDPDTVDPADLAAMMGFASAAPEGGQQNAQPPAGAAPAQPPTSEPPKEDEPYRPFQPNFKLPPQMLSALFEADDVETRHQALVGLLSAFGNSIVEVMEQRITGHHAPRLRDATLTTVQEQNVRQAIQTDFYSTYPELNQYQDAVRTAFRVVANKHKGQAYSPAHRDEIAKLAKAALKSAGINVAGQTPVGQAQPQGQQKPVTQQPTTKPPARKKPVGQAFEAGGARPDFGSPNDSNDPASLVSELSQF